MYEIGRFKIVGEGEEGGDIRLLPYIHPQAFAWWDKSTRTILEALTEADVKGKYVLDFGCGASAILGLAAAKLGATEVAFTEIHPELWQIAISQLVANGLPVIEDSGGDYDFILANLGDAHELGKISQRSSHGLGTDNNGEIIRW